MGRCLTERALLALYERDGTPRQQEHMRQCESCSRRYQLLASDLAAITRVLREEPPRPSFRPTPQLRHLRWAPLLGMVTVLVAFLWAGTLVIRLNRPLLPDESRNGEVLQFLADVSSVTLPLSPPIDSRSETSDFKYLRQALGEE